MNIHTVLRPLLTYFRSKRMAHFMALLSPSPATTILDVGGSGFNWQLIDCSAQVTILNISESRLGSRNSPKNFKFVVGDGTSLGFRDQTFDIVYSNSVLDHLHTAENQCRFARELMRVGKQLWVQTPNKHFWVDPHTLTPFVHYLPKSVQRRILRNFTIWGLVTRPSQEYVNAFLDEVRMLCLHELQEFFPGCQIVRERFLGFTKSFIVLRRDTSRMDHDDRA